MGVRSILIKVVFFHPFVSCSRGPGPALDGSASRQAFCRSAKSSVHAIMPAKRPAAAVQPLESKGKIKKGPSKSTEVGAKPPPVPIPTVISKVDGLGHVEALGAAYMSLESEGGAAGGVAFGTKRGRMPSAKIAIARLYGWSSSGGFAQATCLEAEPGRGQERISEDLVGGPHALLRHRREGLQSWLAWAVCVPFRHLAAGHHRR